MKTLERMINTVKNHLPDLPVKFDIEYFNRLSNPGIELGSQLEGLLVNLIVRHHCVYHRLGSEDERDQVDDNRTELRWIADQLECMGFRGPVTLLRNGYAWTVIYDTSDGEDNLTAFDRLKIVVSTILDTEYE